MSNFIRLLIHIPHGFISGILTPLYPCGGIIYFLAFFFYEITEDWRIKDKAYIDMRGWLVGFPIGMAVGIYIKWRFLDATQK